MNKRSIAILATIFFGINALIPLSTFAQPTSETSTTSQNVDASAGALSMPCDGTGDYDFAINQLDIIAPADTVSYFTNPKTPDTDLTTCDGSGISVQDTRYDGGFVVQIAATDFLKDGVGPESIDLENLAIVTEQVNTSYIENPTGSTNFAGTASNLYAGSAADDTTNENLEFAQVLPFTFTYYGTDYTTIYVCTNGTIAFGSGECVAPEADLPDYLEDANPHLLPYYKDLSTDSTVDGTFGVYYDAAASPVTIRWKGAPCIDDVGNCDNTVTDIVEFEVVLTDNGTDDTIDFEYAATISDSYENEGPIVGVTRGGSGLVPTSANYTESSYSQQQQGLNLASKHTDFQVSDADFTEVKKPNTPATVAPVSGDPSEPLDFTAFVEDGGNPGNSVNQDIIYGHVEGCPGVMPGRVGNYTVFPSFKLTIPSTDIATIVEGNYETTITYSWSDSTTILGGC